MTPITLPKNGIYLQSIQFGDCYIRQFYTKNEDNKVEYIILNFYRTDSQVEPSMVITLTVKEAVALGYELTGLFKNI